MTFHFSIIPKAPHSIICFRVSFSMVLIIDRLEDVVCHNRWTGFKKFTTKETSLARRSETPALLSFHPLQPDPPRTALSDFEWHLFCLQPELNGIPAEWHGNMSVKMVDDKCSYFLWSLCEKVHLWSITLQEKPGIQWNAHRRR